MLKDGVMAKFISIVISIQKHLKFFPCVLSKVGGGHVARMGEERKVYKVLMGKPEGKRPLGRPRLRWEDGIRMDFREIGLGVWIGFGWLRTGTGGGLL
jgi:hypothetical protein